MDEYFHEEIVDTPAGEYTIRFYYESYPEQPYDYGLGFAFDGWAQYGMDQRKDITEGEHADEVLQILRSGGRATYERDRLSAAGMARYLRIKYGLVGVLEVDENYNTSQPDHDLSQRVCGLAWAPDDADEPEKYTANGVAQWRAWANGEVYGWVVTDPQGKIVEDCWGYYGDSEQDYMTGCAKEAIEGDVAERLEQANRVGAGFLGLV